jgi:hypothetical protein
MPERSGGEIYFERQSTMLDNLDGFDRNPIPTMSLSWSRNINTLASASYQHPGQRKVTTTQFSSPQKQRFALHTTKNLNIYIDISKRRSWNTVFVTFSISFYSVKILINRQLRFHMQASQSAIDGTMARGHMSLDMRSWQLLHRYQ